MKNPDHGMTRPCSKTSIVGMVVLNSLLVSAPLVLADRRAFALLPVLVLVAGSALMCITEFCHTANRTESLSRFGSYQYAALAGSLLLLLTKWSSLTEFLVTRNSGSAVGMTMGFVLVISGCVVRSLSLRSLADGFRSDTSGQVLVTSRIYSIVRHPSETGLLLASVGFSVMLGAWQTALLLLPASLALSIYRMRLEESWLLATFGSDYDNYRHQTGQWLPRLKRSAAGTPGVQKTFGRNRKGRPQPQTNVFDPCNSR